MTPHQGLGAFVVTAKNLSMETVKQFKKIGGIWIAPVIYNDDASGPDNRNWLAQNASYLQEIGILPWGWFNGNGGYPPSDALNIAALAHQFGLKGIILDLESQYQYPEGNANLMPQLVYELRKLCPIGSMEISVSTNSMNGSMIWNGRVLTVPQSFYDLKIRVMPQWYSSYYAKSGKTPQFEMQWLKLHGNTDGNFKSINAKKTNYRGLPLSYVHPTLEVTGLEGSSLSQELADCKEAEKYGLTPGISIYTLENMPDSDLKLLELSRGIHYIAEGDR